MLGNCVTHIFLINAADLKIPLDSLAVDAQAEYDPRGQAPDNIDAPVYPYNFRYQVQVASPASDEDLARLHAEVQRVCPILNLRRNPQEINGSVALVSPAAEELAA
ncbi:hypothetical protein A6A27_30530 [Micromonospora sp. CB01531]|nr:hypothetical protein A6A27_30530 [Micromonospora sp. CB01531]